MWLLTGYPALLHHRIFQSLYTVNNLRKTAVLVNAPVQGTHAQLAYIVQHARTHTLHYTGSFNGFASVAYRLDMGSLQRGQFGCLLEDMTVVMHTRQKGWLQCEE